MRERKRWVACNALAEHVGRALQVARDVAALQQRAGLRIRADSVNRRRRLLIDARALGRVRTRGKDLDERDG